MESQPQNPEFRNNLENFQPCEFVAFKLNKHVQKVLFVNMFISL